MKAPIIIYLIAPLFLSSCKKEGSEKKVTQDVEHNAFFYKDILQEFKEVDTSKYYVNYVIQKDFKVTNELQLSLAKGETLTDQELINLKKKEIVKKPNLILGEELLRLIELSKKDSLDKIKLNYVLSYPHMINEKKILIFNAISFENPYTNSIKGGTERVILFEKINSEWLLKEKKGLIDY